VLTRARPGRPPERPQPPAPRLAGSPPAPLARGGAAVLWLLVASAVLLGACGALRPAAPAPPAPPAVSPLPDGLAGWAELYVATYLAAGAGEEDRLRAFYPALRQLTAPRPGTLYAGRTTTVAIDSAAHPGGSTSRHSGLGCPDGAYAGVTVAVEVLAADGARYRPVGTRFYTAPVCAQPPDRGHGRRYVAVALPALVAAPPSGDPVRLAYRDQPLPATNPAAATAARFLDAYLADRGELARYTEPGSALRPVTPPAFREVRVTAVVPAATVRAGAASTGAASTGAAAPAAELAVLVEATGVDTAGRAQQLAYPLRLTRRDGQWVVTDLQPTPDLAATTDPARPEGTPAP
jgi:hypothetical protein